VQTLSALLLVCLSVLTISASGANGTDGGNTTPSKDSSDVDKLRGEFGIGLAVIRLRKPQIDTAEVRGGVVRIVDETKTRITPWLQAQYVYDKWGGPYLSPGMFVGLGLGSSGTTFDTFGIGVLLAQKRTRNTDKTDTRALNVGLGVYTTKYKTLSDEAEEGQPLPAGVESVNYRTKSQSGLVLTVSFSF
jgi:hypothetical protein